MPVGFWAASLIVPLTGLLKDNPPPPQAHEQSLVEALREATGHSGFWLLALGFFVCGFQVVFIGVHLPAYLVDQHLPASVGTTVLALVGLFNVFGTYIAGWLGGRHAKPKLLTALYLLRGVVIVGVMVILAQSVRLDGEGWWKKSRLLPTMQPVAKMLRVLAGDHLPKRASTDG